ncbi:DegT/DnrJ/EryC1/StrS family aminotransferase [Rhodoferax sp.]|uniref:DegT/DnrJ/EryC1/StrS family aminotransferase n=1 Tax=Rhodoferax sp. TaxID=50421 RepID=UPI00276168AC|nr:DegT/DnrJ/EryC1/StrS family aminotransferase [Rhodoferax sp.]
MSTVPSFQLSAPPLAVAARRALPRGPVLDWSSLTSRDAPTLTSVTDLRHSVLVTSGRAAIYQALVALHLPPGSAVLVPSYHCPTMVAPVIVAQLCPSFFGIRSDGLPDLERIDPSCAKAAKAMIVSHYFGRSQSLAEVRNWCDQRGMALIEDCAHCFFGQAGERPIGAWGDYATASLTKFFPVPEGGLLASNTRALSALTLSRPGLKAQLKGWLDVLELASQYHRLAGLADLLRPLFRLKNARRVPPSGSPARAPAPTPHTLLADSDMARVDQAPLWAAKVLSALPRSRIVTRRQQNFAAYARHFGAVHGARPLFAVGTAASTPDAPYVFALWVDDAERVYQALREQHLPVFRWDRIWPGTPALAGDQGPLWSRHVLQLLCHQDLSEADVVYTSQTILTLLATPARAPSGAPP